MSKKTKNQPNQSKKPNRQARKRQQPEQPIDKAANYLFMLFSPPEDLRVSEWADRYRILSPENSAETGKWKTRRTPYLREIMDSFTDATIENITLVASSQVGKTEAELNMLGYAIDVDPGPMMFIMPTTDNAEDFSKRRLSTMLRDTKRLTLKVSEAKSRNKSSTITKKSFPGGMLTLTGSNSPAALASTPARYIFGDELDRWATSAGSEGDPWALAQARTKTFFNRKLVAVSTPTVKGFSAIETMFNLGTREHWCHECPECHSYHEINFDDIKIQFTTNFNGGKKDYIVDEVNWACKSCGCLIPQSKMRRQPAKWIALNPAAKANGHRSFWLNGFASPWANWNEIALEFLQAKNDPERLKVVFNTTFGKLWEERGEIEDEETILSRRENYEADLPDGVVILTCGVDTQDNRLEYEVVGHGLYGETWGITRGVILGKPDNDTVWQRLDDVINRTYTFKDGKGLLVYLTCVDSGGHYTQEVYCACRERANRNVFAIRGIGGQDKPYTPPPKQAKITVDGRYIGQCWYYNLGVDAGKTKIMNALKVQEPGARYCHFPLNEDRGYNVEYFQGLLSERLVRRRSSGQDKYVWEKLPGHIRNEPLDCRNYAMAALSILNPDIEAERRRLFAPDQKQSDQIKKSRKRKQRERMDDW